MEATLVPTGGGSSFAFRRRERDRAATEELRRRIAGLPVKGGTLIAKATAHERAEENEAKSERLTERILKSVGR